MSLRKLIISIVSVLILASVPIDAHAISIKVNGVVVVDTADVPPCLVPAGATSCTATTAIPEVPDIAGQAVIILPGAAATATAEAANIAGTSAVPGVINSIKVTGLALLYRGAPTSGTIEISYGNRFPLPVDVWRTPGEGGFLCDSTLTPADTGHLICRSYGYTATGSFCRLDATGNCLTADPDGASMTESVTFEKSTDPTTIATVAIGTGLAYSVAPGGVGNNDFFPLSKLGIVSANDACEPRVAGTCADIERLDNTLVFALKSGDAIFLAGSPIGLGGPNPGAVRNRLKFAEIDIQPIYDPNNNDINLGSAGMRQVAAIASATFDPTTIQLGTVLLSVGGAPGVSPLGSPTFVDVNGDGKTDAVFFFSIPALAAAGADCTPPVAVLTGVATFTSTFTEKVGKGQNARFQTVTVTEALGFSGSQGFKCAPKAGP